jgi:hypothetical protein
LPAALDNGAEAREACGMASDSEARLSAPVPDALDGDARDATAEVSAEVQAEVDGDVVRSAPNPVLDLLVARDAALAPAPPPAPASAAPEKRTTPLQEWGVAVALMILFGFICVAFMSFFRG